MNLKTIRDTVIATVGSDTELQVADYNVFINEGYTNIISKILDERKDFFPDSEIIAVTASDLDVTPTKTWNNITLIQVDFGDGTGYQTLTKDSLENVTANGQTRLVYHLWGDVIYLPDFDKAFNMKIFGYVIPADLSGDSDTPTFSTLLHPLLIIWGVGRAVESHSASENFLDGGRKRTEFWEALEQILPSVIMKDMTNVRSLI